MELRDWAVKNMGVKMFVRRMLTNAKAVLTLNPNLKPLP